MFKTLFKFVILLAVLLVGYNFLFGTPAEKESSRVVLSQVRDLGASVVDLLKSEKDKFDDGKYDEALAKVKSAIGIETQRAQEFHPECVGECQHLEAEQSEIERRLQELRSTNGLNEMDRAFAFDAIREEILELTRKTQSLANELN